MPLRPRLTARQREALDLVRAHVELHDCPPTIRELGVSMGIRSTNGVSDHLKALERKGYLLRPGLKSRTMRVLELTDGAAVLARLARSCLDERSVAHVGGQLPMGRFTPSELAELLAVLNTEITFEAGVVTVIRGLRE